jgi:ferredoxin
MCVVRAPDVFTQNETDGVVQVLQENPEPALHKAVKDAVEACPVEAIRFEE